MITKGRVIELFDNLASGRVLVYGDLMLDQYLWGKVDRISPEAPVPVVEIERESLLLGGAANVARNIVSLGCGIELVGLVGDDDNGTKIRYLLEREGISRFRLISDQKRPTTMKTRIIAHQQQVVRADRESRQPIDGYTETAVFTHIQDKIDEADCVLISDYGKGAITPDLLKKIVALAREKGKFVAVDPKEINFKNYRQVSLITPNSNEASFAAGMRIVDDDTLKQVGWRLINKLDLESLLITLGPQGMALFEREDMFSHLPTVAKKVYDVTGAGDTVIAVMTAMVAAGANKLEAAYIANQAAGMVVEHLGTAVVERDDLLETIENQLAEDD
ncbi:MAG: D-glycero-beta-D-manno-heptose-7-phosphate kinase [candidate division Zixibacteria bacterium]|nr:D-glycero-beta-D-manno-heptose-7-phosphate kinase [candidate division Zixibacteria bacterium]